MSDNGAIPELTETEKARWAAVDSAIGALSAGVRDGTLDADGLAATVNQIQQVDVDRARFRESLHVPAVPAARGSRNSDFVSKS
ncbi:MAG: hypothetical protein JWR37_5962 [Mycobacterium sp.]|jgi:hypothetical protein|nr:hypothetical protein [Mycobacterium sp.]